MYPKHTKLSKKCSLPTATYKQPLKSYKNLDSEDERDVTTNEFLSRCCIRYTLIFQTISVLKAASSSTHFSHLTFILSMSKTNFLPNCTKQGFLTIFENYTTLHFVYILIDSSFCCKQCIEVKKMDRCLVVYLLVLPYF